MKNLINNIFLVSLLFFFPLFTEGKSSEEKSFIQEVKARITNEKENKAENTKEEVKTEKNENKVEYKERENVKAEKKEEVHKEREEVKAEDGDKYKYEYKDKNEEKGPPEEKSRIQIVKDKITEEKVKEEAKKEEKDKSKEKHDHDYYHDERDQHHYYYDHGHNKRYRHDHHSGFFGGFWDVYDGFSGYFIDVRYDDYPYANSSDFNFRSPENRSTPSNKIAFLYSSVETSYLGKDIRDNYGATVKLSGNIYSLHLNYFYQRIFSSEESMAFYSVNGGISFALQNLTLTPFLGAFYIESLEKARFSYGANLQVFLPANYIIDLYTLNSSYGSLNFNNFSASLNYAFYRFNIGAGFNYNNYAGVNFSGPLAKLSVWL